MRKFTFFTAGLLAAQLATSNPYTAEVQEVTVYSSLDKSSLDKLAASISILDADSVTSRNAQHIGELSNTVPNLNFSGGASRGRFAQIRGIGDIEQFVDPKAYPSVGLIVDGIELNGLFGAGLLFDAEQVEVLRGPQGTRFGASALAGAINISSAAADSRSSDFVEAGYGKFDSYQVGGAFGGTVSENLNARISLRQYGSDGYIENEFLDKDNTANYDEFLGRAKLNWQLNDANRLDFTFLHIDNDNGYDAFSLDNTHLRTQSDEPGEDKQRVTAVGLVHSLRLTDEVALESKLTHVQANTVYSYDEDWTDTSECTPVFFCSFDRYQRDRKDSTADIRLVGNAFVFGVYYQQSETDLDRDRFGDLATDFESDYETDRIAAYGELDIKIADATTLNLGARIEKFEDDYTDSNSITADSDDDLWSAEASIQHEYSDSNSSYLLVSRGVKAGGVNTDAATNFAIIDPVFQADLNSRLQFESESLTNYEIGYRYRPTKKPLTLDLVAFYNDRNNPQFETFIFDGLSSFAFVGYLDNAKSAESHGIELSMTYKPVENITLDTNLSYIESSIRGFRVYDFDLGSYTNISSKDQPRQSGYQYHLAGKYQATEQLSISLQLEGRDSYQYAYYFDRESGNINLIHANIRYQKGPYDLTIWARNLRDSEYAVQGLYFANDPADFFTVNRLYTQSGEPRNAGVTLRYNFD